MRKPMDPTGIPIGHHNSHEGCHVEPHPRLRFKPNPATRRTPNRDLDSSSSLHPADIWRYCSGSDKNPSRSSTMSWALAHRGLVSKPGREDSAIADHLYVEKQCADSSRSRTPIIRARPRPLNRLRALNQRKRLVKKKSLEFISRSQGSLRRIISIPKLSRSSTITDKDAQKDAQRGKAEYRDHEGRNPSEAQEAHGECSSGSNPGGSYGQPSSNPESPLTSRRRSSQANINRRQKKVSGDDQSDDNDENIETGSQSANQAASAKKYSCPFFKAFPRDHWACKDSTWTEVRKVKDHLKRNHYNGHTPLEIQGKHQWIQWYRFIIQGTDRENRVFPNSDPNFADILDYLVEASEQLEGQEAPCFGTRMLKLFQHAQSNPTEAERLVRGLAAILDRPYNPVSSSMDHETYLTETTAAAVVTAPSVPSGVPRHLQYADIPIVANVYTWPTDGSSTSALAMPNTAHTKMPDEITTSAGEIGYFFTASPVPNKPRHGNEEWEITTAVPTHSAADTVEEWLHGFPRPSVSETIHEPITLSQHNATGRAPTQDRSSETIVVPPDTLATFPLPNLDMMPIRTQNNGFVDPRRTQLSDPDSIPSAPEHTDVAIPISPLSTSLFVNAGQPAHDSMPAPRFVQPQRRLLECNSKAKRKRMRAESVGNIQIPSYDSYSQSNPLPTPSPSVLSRAAGPPMTPSLLTPFTANTTNSDNIHTVHQILVVTGRRPEIFFFKGHISGSIDSFMDFLYRVSCFNFSKPSRQLWLMGEKKPLHSKDDVLAKLASFWDDSSILFSKDVPWFWVDMPCRCLIDFSGDASPSHELFDMNPIYRPSVFGLDG